MIFFFFLFYFQFCFFQCLSFIYVFSGLLKGFKDNKYFVTSEDSTSLHIRSLLIRCADWCDSAQQTGNFDGQLLCAGSYEITYGTDK